MPLFAAGRGALCGTAQIMGGGFSAGEGKLKVTPGRRARRDARFLPALGLKPPTVTAPGRQAMAVRLEELERQNSTQPHPLSINLLCPGLNMSRCCVCARGGGAGRAGVGAC